MRERVKVFTHLCTTGASVIGTPMEDDINRWLQSQSGRIVRVTQSESERHNGGQHLTVCVWYIPGESPDGGEANGEEST
jgi:hypothetical protein